MKTQTLPQIAVSSLVVIAACLILNIIQDRRAETEIQILWLMGLALYLLPWLVAIERENPKRAAIGLTNFLLGWTGLGWIFSLIWSFKRYDFR